jgi:hypothetical protein
MKGDRSDGCATAPLDFKVRITDCLLASQESGFFRHLRTGNKYFITFL